MSVLDMMDYTERARFDDLYVITGYNSSEKKLNRFIEADYDFGYVVGSYLAVGTVNLVTYKNSTRGIVFWYVEKDNYDSAIEQLKSSINLSFNLSISVREQKKSSTLQLVCYSKPLATLLSGMGKKSGRKNLPDKYFYKNKDYIKGLLDGIEMFDGHRPDLREVLKKRKLSMSVVELYNSLKMY